VTHIGISVYVKLCDQNDQEVAFYTFCIQVNLPGIMVIVYGNFFYWKKGIVCPVNSVGLSLPSYVKGKFIILIMVHGKTA